MKKAACIFIWNDFLQKVLLVTRPDSTQVGLPGGKVEEGEHAYMAALRELKEETGIDPYSTISHVMEDVCHGDVDYLTTGFFCNYNKIQIPGGCEPNITCRWGDIQELIDNSPFKEYNIKFIIKLLKENL